jgi:hypothetical protein
VVTADTAFSAVPVIDVVVVVASGLYLVGSAPYAHNSSFRTAMDDAGEGIDEVGNTIAKGEVRFVEEVTQAGETDVHAVDEVGRVFIEDAVSAGREESQVEGAGLHRLVTWVPSLFYRGAFGGASVGTRDDIPAAVLLAWLVGCSPHFRLSRPSSLPWPEPGAR